jgi:cytoskeletal protein CcmA (bactofilin family)
MALLSKDRELDRGGTRSSEGRTGDLSVLTRDVRIVGDVETTGRVRLEGTVTGSVRARSIEISGGGSVEGDVLAMARDEDNETFTVEGTVHGAVRARNVEIGEAGSVLGGIEADHATVRGRVQGGIQARDRLALKATAVVEGDIDARRLALEEGGQVNGNIRIGDRAALKSKEAKESSASAPAEEPTKVASGGQSAMKPGSGKATQAGKGADAAKTSGVEQARASA